MNRYLEIACGWFGAVSCETASAGQIVLMIFAAAFAGIFGTWLVGRIRVWGAN